MKVTQDDLDNVFRKIVRKNSGLQCWIWCGGTNQGRLIQRIDGRAVDVRRILYAVLTKKQVYGIDIRMSCGTYLCCKPEHIAEFRRVNRLFGDDNPARKQPEKIFRGASHPNARLSEQFVGYLLRELAAGTPQRELARRHNLSQGTVRDIKTGRRWRHHTERVPTGLLPEQPHFR